MSGMTPDEIRNNPLQCLDLLHDEMSEQLIKMKEVQKEIEEIDDITRNQAIDLLVKLADIDMKLASCAQMSMELNMILVAANRILRREADKH